jgi:AAA15 family ATPase/GTPase
MLIEFQVTNFRSFRSTQVLSLVASAAGEHQATNTFEAGLPGFGRFLRSAVIYGANAAGKTNLLLALQYMQSLVVGSAAATPATSQAYMPFKFAKATRTAPSEFRITFAQNGTRYEYGFALDAKRVVEEWLMEYVHAKGREIFSRSYDQKAGGYEWKFGSSLKGSRSVWRDATRPNALFLSTATQLNSKQLLPVFEWFQKRLVVIAGPSTMNQTLTLQLLDQPGGKEKLLPFLREADLGIADVTVKREAMPAGSGAVMLVGAPIIEQRPGTAAPNLVTVTLSHLAEDGNPVGLDLAEESAGTRMLFASAGAWLNVFANGEVLLVDEIDTSLHPLLVRFLVRRFHSAESNARNAQLVFNTHNTTLLRQDLFRRDQIWFVEKDATGASRLYPLSDFKPRTDEQLELGYLKGRYGALPILDETKA